MGTLVKNLKNYLICSRIYLSPIPLTAGLVGFKLSHAATISPRLITLLFMIFIGWGINQTINDYSGCTEDMLNAPDRPIPSGKITKKFVLHLSIFLTLAGLAVTAILSIPAALAYIAVFFINIFYEQLKKIFLMGNITFGIMIAGCAIYIQLGLTGTVDKNIIVPAILIAMINTSYALLTDFKDVIGDKAAGVKSLAATLSPHKAARFIPLVIALPFLGLYAYAAHNSAGNACFSLSLCSLASFVYAGAIIWLKPLKTAEKYLIWLLAGVVFYQLSLIYL